MPLLACIGDVHGRYDVLAGVVTRLKYERIDAVLMTGDFEYRSPRAVSPATSADLVADTLTWVQELGVPILFVPGNHDQRALPIEGNIDRTVRAVAGVRVAGLGGAGPAVLGFPYEWSEEEIRGIEIPEYDVLLSHAPPARTTVDLLYDGKTHVGSEAVRELAESRRGLLICGHIHESVGVERLGQCVVYNVGALGAPFGKAQYGLVDLDPRAERASISHFDLEAKDQWSVEFDLGASA